MAVMKRETDAPAMAVASRLSRYKPMEEKPVRPLDVCETSGLRERRNMLRSMDLDEVLELMDSDRQSDMIQAIYLALRERKLLIPNNIIDRLSVEKETEAGGWTGTLVAYEAPGVPFGDRIAYAWNDGKTEYSSVFDVPEQFRGRSNCALVVEYPDFELVHLGDGLFQFKAAGEHVSLVEDFPAKRGNDRSLGHRDDFLYDEQFSIPRGASRFPFPGNKQGIDHALISMDAHVGLVLRICWLWGQGDNKTREVILDANPSKTDVNVLLF